MSGQLTDVAGIGIAHHSMGDTGCTVIVAPESAIAAVDVRGGGPGTRETDLLEPQNTVQRVHAICLSGGSAYGLATADGVMAALEEHGIGFAVLGPDTPGPIVPIVPAAVIFDLLVGQADHRPTRESGYSATCEILRQWPRVSSRDSTARDAAAQDGTARDGTARDGTAQDGTVQDTQSAVAAHGGIDQLARNVHTQPALSGSVGAGCGATAGVLRGGFGQASRKVGPYTIAAGIVANPMGSVIDPSTGKSWFDSSIAVDIAAFSQLQSPIAKLNTTIGVIVTDAPISKAQAKRVAMVGHDGIALAVRPAHAPFDGDTLFCLSTGDGQGVDVHVLHELSAAVSYVVAEAILDAVVSAESGFGQVSLREIRVQ
ncbi:P1 family peptidase [Corynebacterium sp. HS2168-gen11]|uniref:P1 family peptidase n=1 Tax=Corynebacterium sp. HS2168-gen11 TaxID=2974027 RepID=UPI00216B248B|nr:P1 family peptidase [Corynebacterium sp. HS2168-gen11]MCS4535284.1 P1 family peptidase [Corynebacterium sp. HS2168-gen11]